MRLIARPADFIIGGVDNVYMRRWWIIPRNPWFNIYLHKIERSDDDRALHDHPWWNVSIVLKGSYREITPGNLYHRCVGAIVVRQAEALHRLEVDEPCWTLFITGPRLRHWGFLCPRGWVHWREFTDGPNGETVGRGCGDAQ